MTGYEYSRNFFDWAFENPDINTPSHTATYMWIIDKWNRSGQVQKLVLPSSESMAAIGVKSYNTYIKVLQDLIEFGFIEMIQKSKNQFTANIIALSNFDKALDKALDKAMIKHTTKQHESTIQSTDESNYSIYKQSNKVTIEQSNIDSGVVPPPTPKAEVAVVSKKTKNKKNVEEEYTGKFKTIEDLPKLNPNIDYHIDSELRLQVFRHLEKSPNKYPTDEVAKFVKYWSELNEDRNLPKWKITKQKTGTWQVASRLSNWINNNFSNNGKSKQHISPIIEPRQGQDFGYVKRTA